MVTLPGYKNLKLIQEGATTVIYRGQREEDEFPAIVKILKHEYPTLEDITRLKHEYEITKDLDLAGIIKPYSLENYQNGIALILEDVGGRSLQQFIWDRPGIGDFLNIAIQLASSLGELHKNNIIHKDIKPCNIIINPKTLEVKITDFSIASRLVKEIPKISNPNLIEGTLAYMSPEQTGRMNRSLDYRTDFYSLGVTFYEMIAGELPFKSTDPLELIHCHIAKTPAAPHEIVPEIPLAISKIVMKLLAKTAEERYESAWGLKADLETCLTQLQTTGKIENFPIGQLDYASQLNVPQKLYGRQQEVATLMAAFDRVAGGGTKQSQTELLLVSGYSGIGKTSIIKEIHKPIVRQRGYFIAGKFDQFKRNIPYASITQAFQSLIGQLLTEPADKLQIWKNKLLEALGQNGQVIIDVIPQVELIIGKQPEIPQLPPTETQNRFNLVFKQFIHVFTQKQHPLVIFLDDLQWADSATLKLMQLLMTDPESQYLLLIGAYRDNEVSSGHPLIETIEEIQKNGIVVNHIVLQSLNLSDVKQLIADTLKQTTDQVNSLAKLIFNQTGGNPFFLTQLLQELKSENLLKFNFTSLPTGRTKGEWQWNIEEIQAIGIADKSAVELVASRIAKLPLATQKVLKLAACVGNIFTLDVLSIVNEKSPRETAIELYSALRTGLILPLSESYKIPLVFDVEKSQIYRVAYKFLHDRVQQAAYFLIPESQKQATHLKIGRLLLKNTPAEEIEANIFDIVNQLNLGIDILTQQSEKDELARLNLIAGRKAKAAIAYELAFKYLNAGLELLSAAWDTNYDLTWALYVEATESAYLSGEFDRMQQLAEIVLQQAKTLLDKIKVYECKIMAGVADRKLLEAIVIALQTLKFLGVNFPEEPTEEDINRALAETASLIPEKGIEDLMNLPQMTDAYSLAAMQILSSIIPAAYHAAPKLYLLIVLSQVNLSITQGNAPASAFAYSSYGLLLCGIANNIELGYQFGQLALNLLLQFSSKSVRARVLLVVANFILHWKFHLKESLALFQAGYQNALESGDLELIAWNSYFECQASYLIGEELTGLDRKIESYNHAIRQLKQQLPLNDNEILRQVVLNLMGRCVDPCRLIGEAYNEERSLPENLAANNMQALYYLHLHKLILCYLFGNYPQALQNATLAAQYVTSVPGQPIVPHFYFYDSLVRLAIYTSVSELEQNLVLRQVQANQKKMRFWARHSPDNYQHKYELVEAEKARVLGQNMKAMEYYDRAIQGANEQGYIQEEALANELAALFYLSRGRKKIAKTYMTDAYYGYIRWGSQAKVRNLDEKYPQLISRNLVKETAGFEKARKTTTTTNRTSTGLLDLATVMKATQAISSEIVLEKLLEKLIKILIENAAAQKGFLILAKSEQLHIEAAAEAGKDEVVVLQSIPVETSDDLPISVINYVARTKEDVVLNQATKEGIFTSDRYILNYQTLSLLCAPILYQGKLIAILYLENNLATGVFNQERLELLKLLTSQVAISIENSLLYHTLEEKVLDRTRELQEKNEQLSNTLQQVKTMQNQIIAQEKLASLGALTAGIAHEIKNPLNFVNNFAEVSSELIQELAAEINNGKERVLSTETVEYIDSILNDLEQNIQTINKHGKRADSIVRGMLSHSRESSGKRELSDINALLSEAVQLSYHAMRGKDINFNITLETDYDDSISLVEIVPPDISRVFINIINNACYALKEKKLKLAQDFEPRIAVKTKNMGDFVEIRLKDNGFGIPPDIGDKIFHPFFTTKPTGEGTGLGLSISHDIIVGQHSGEIKVESEPGLCTEFIIVLPKLNV
ncbi:trifunctional serine/threonine-protein kinase/ATP-binding protein/sensor histidine kinase [Microseira wollei]|uniref:histidine kinase n=1 Tax=Microseira wollei NIES-4236 TaxID=2530354 RepID=A0AAV3XEA3_9CYAN|nr:ATP-binding sensor histidine kinase [Microseira wollei]GET40563.1 multi-sensor signal transduction multi-kinase [Microseira wollei NIES-4236]